MTVEILKVKKDDDDWWLLLKEDDGVRRVWVLERRDRTDTQVTDPIAAIQAFKEEWANEEIFVGFKEDLHLRQVAVEQRFGDDEDIEEHGLVVFD